MEELNVVQNTAEESAPGSPGPDAGSDESSTSKQAVPIRVISITSGKGGVGKTNIVANLAYNLSTAGKRVLVIDGDVGLANIDVLLGLVPQYTLQHVFSGEKSVKEIIVEGPGGMKILPATSGVEELAQLGEEQKLQFLSDLDSLNNEVDVVLVDTAAGISSNVIYFTIASQEIVVVATPEPTSITDAYALMKVLSNKYHEKNFKLLPNMVNSEQEARDVYRNISRVAEKFLNISIEYYGYVLRDPNILKSVREQKAVSELFPESEASKNFAALSKRLCSAPVSNQPKSSIQFFWRSFFPSQ